MERQLSPPDVLPKLFKRTNTGAIQFWEISVAKDLQTGHGIVRTVYGQEGTDNPQEAIDPVTEGKNIGKKNETTPYSQAQLQAQQEWDKKIKKGYSASYDAVVAGEQMLPCIKPMKANVWQDHKHKMKYPGLAQVKFDGFRCTAEVIDGKCKLYSYTQVEWKTVPHINEMVEMFCFNQSIQNIIFDGELYHPSIHRLKVDPTVEPKITFQTLSSIVKRDDLHDDHKLVEFHIFDIFHRTEDCGARISRLNKMFEVGCFPEKGRYYNLVCAKSFKVENDSEVEVFLEKAIKKGYEGLMIRSAGAQYEHKKGNAVMKYKKMVEEASAYHDAEFLVIDVKPGKRGKMKDKGIFVCMTKSGAEFDCKMEGPLDALKEYLDNKQKYIGKYLTVRYQELSDDGSLRFPVGVRFREGQD